MPTDYECAYYAQQVYTEGGGKPLPGWEIKETSYPNYRWNFGMASYWHRESSSLVIAFRGTESLWDLISDIAIWQRHIHPNQEHADNIAARIQLEAELGGALFGTTFSDVFVKDEQVALSELRHVVALLAATLVTAAVTSSASYATANLGLPAPLLNLLNVGIGVEVGNIAYEVLIKKLNDDLIQSIDSAEKLTHFKEKLEASFQKELKRGTNSITFVGHSMGAYIAEMSSCRLKKLFPNARLKINAVTFESPGTLSILEAAPEYKLSDYNHIKSYLSAPNLVNTCHPHAGQVHRIYISHVESDWTWSHFSFSLWQSASRTAIYAALPITFFTGPTIVPMVTFFGGLLSKMAAQGLHIVTGDYGWLKRQHDKSNILACFSKKTGLPVYYSTMKSWPHASSIFSMAEKQAEIYLKTLKPFPNDAPGVRTIFWENHMNELQSQSLPSYDVIEHRGELPDWASYDLATDDTSCSTDDTSYWSSLKFPGAEASLIDLGGNSDAIMLADKDKSEFHNSLQSEQPALVTSAGVRLQPAIVVYAKTLKWLISQPWHWTVTLSQVEWVSYLSVDVPISTSCTLIDNNVAQDKIKIQSDNQVLASITQTTSTANQAMEEIDTSCGVVFFNSVLMDVPPMPVLACYDNEMVAYVFAKGNGETALTTTMNTDSTQSSTIQGDTYDLSNCRAVSFYGESVLYCEGEQTTAVSKPIQAPPRVVEQATDLLMLAVVGRQMLKNACGWLCSVYQAWGETVSPEEYVQQQQQLEQARKMHQISDDLLVVLKKTMPPADYYYLQFEYEELEFDIEDWETALSYHDVLESDKVEAITERLSALVEELVEEVSRLDDKSFKTSSETESSICTNKPSFNNAYGAALQYGALFAQSQPSSRTMSSIETMQLSTLEANAFAFSMNSSVGHG